MSIAARKHLCDRLIFQRDSERADLMDPARTHTELIALLIEILDKGFHLEITAVRADHHDDSGLGRHTHANGEAVDCWPLITNTAGHYLDAEAPLFQDFLEAAAASPWLYQIGLAGTAWTPANAAAAGASAFHDTGADHVHIGSIG